MNYIDLAMHLIDIPSVAPNEAEILNAILAELTERHFQITQQYVDPGRFNIFASVGVPQIIFTTHLDVVPANKNQFKSYIDRQTLFGRGACDAKGIAATMIEAATKLLAEQASNFALLFVVGEEVDGIGAKKAVEYLKSLDLRFIVNGEPTENKLAAYHRGSIAFEAEFEGKACHSGYPHLGIDANRMLINTAMQLLAADFGCHPTMGKATINLGQISGGVALNVVSPKAKLRGGIRTVTDNAVAIDLLRQLCSDAFNLNIFYNMEPVQLYTLPGFETIAANYCSDIPHYKTLNVPCLMYGPGSILQAHTENEYVKIAELDRAVDDYIKIYRELNSSI